MMGPGKNIAMGGAGRNVEGKPGRSQIAGASLCLPKSKLSRAAHVTKAKVVRWSADVPEESVRVCVRALCCRVAPI